MPSESDMSVLVARALKDTLEDLHTCYTKPLVKEGHVMVGGTALWRPLDEERRRLTAELDQAVVNGKMDRLNAVKYRIYCEELCDMTKVAVDAEVSARIRMQYASCVNDAHGGRLVTDAEESVEVISNSDEDELDDEALTGLSGAGSAGQMPFTSTLQPAPPPPKTATTTANKKKEDYRKKKDEESRMFTSCQVRDERGILVPTLGPFGVPCLADRAIKPGTEIRSRRSLKKKAMQESGSDDDLAPEPFSQASSSNGLDSPNWVTVFQKIPSDTAKKILEALKVRTRPSDDTSEAVAKAIFRSGIEKLVHTMEKQRMLESMLQKKWGRQQLIDQLEDDFTGTIDSSSELRKNACVALVLSTTTTEDIYERTIVYGLQNALRTLRPRLLKKVYVDVLSLFDETVPKEEPSVDKQIEYIVWKLVPRERLRLQAERVNEKVKSRGISYQLETTGCRCIANTGKILFRLLHVSTLRKNTQRHYSPEFEYGNNRWSLLTMQSKDHLALYLCQTGSVHCKFILTLLNSEESDSIRNEGSQRFQRTSAENDWGFNNIVSLDRLLDPAAGFWDQASDSILVDIALMIISDENHAPLEPVAGPPATKAVEAKPAAAQQTNRNPTTQQQQPQQTQQQQPPTATNAHANANANNNAAHHNPSPVVETNAALLKQLVEEEMAQKESEWRKKMTKHYKQERTKLQRQEEIKRKEIETAEVQGFDTFSTPFLEELGRLRSRDRRKGGNNKAKEDVDEIHDLNVSLKEEIAAASHELSELQTQRSKLSSEFQQHRNAENQVKGNLKQWKTKIAQQRKLLEELEEEIEQLSQQPASPPPAVQIPVPVAMASSPPHHQQPPSNAHYTAHPSSPTPAMVQHQHYHQNHHHSQHHLSAQPNTHNTFVPPPPQPVTLPPQPVIPPPTPALPVGVFDSPPLVPKSIDMPTEMSEGVDVHQHQQQGVRSAFGQWAPGHPLFRSDPWATQPQATADMSLFSFLGAFSGPGGK